MIFFLLFISTIVHSFHLSKTEINFDSESSSLQIASKVFIDDLEDELKLYGYKNLKIGTKNEASNVDSILAVYFQHHLLFESEEVLSNYNYLGKELSDDLIAIWSYIEIPLEKEPKELSIQNTILTKLYDDQKNMVIVKKNNKMIKHEMLDHKETSFMVQINE